MAKKKEKTVNKTQLIKDAMAKNLNASPKEIAEKLKEHKISAAYVSTIKSGMKGKKKKKQTRVGRPAGRPSAKSTSSDKVSVASLVKAKKLAEELGGVEKAKDVLNALAKLTG